MVIHRRDGKYFSGALVTPQSGDRQNVALRVAQLKRMYLRIIAYGREVFHEDWSELLLPDFAALSRGPVEATKALRSMSIVLLWFAQRAGQVNGLKVELDCLLATLSRESGALIAANIASALRTSRDSEAILPLRAEAPPEPATVSEAYARPDGSHAATPSPAHDHDTEYKALQLLFEVISSEAEQLREKLMVESRTREKIEAMTGDLRAQIEKMTLEREDATTAIETLQSENTQLVLERASATAEAAKESERISSFLDEANLLFPEALHLGDILKLLHKQKQQAVVIRELQEANDALRASNETLSCKMQAADQEIRRKVDELMRMEARLEEQKVENETIRDEWSAATRNLERSQASHQNSSQELETLRETLEELNLKLGQRDTSLQNELQLAREAIGFRERRIQKLRSKLFRRTESLNTVKAANLVVAAHRSKLRKKLTKVWRRYHDLRTRLEQQSSSHAEEILALRGQLDGEASRCLKLEETLALLNADNARLSERQRALEDELGAFESQARLSIDESNRERHQQMSEYESQLGSLRSELEASQITESKRETQYQQVREKADKLEAAMQLLVAENEALKARIAAADAATVELEKSIETSQRLASERQKDFDDHRRECAKVLESLKCSQAASSSTSKSLGDALQQKTSECDHLTSLLTASREKNAMLHAQLETGNKKAHRYEEEIQLHCTNYEKLKEENESLRQELAKVPNMSQLRDEKHVLDRILEDTIAAKEDLEREIESLLEQLAQARSRTARLESEIDELRLAKQEAAADLSEARAALERHSSEVERLKSSMDRLQREAEHERATLRTQLEQTSTEADEWQRQCHSLEDDLRRLEAEYETRRATWSVERANLTEWLKQQEGDLQAILACKTHQVVASAEASMHPASQDASVATDNEADPDVVALLRSKEGEISKLTVQMKQHLASIKAEHDAILQAWHSLGSRIYRDTLYCGPHRV